MYEKLFVVFPKAPPTPLMVPTSSGTNSTQVCYVPGVTELGGDKLVGNSKCIVSLMGDLSLGQA